MAQRRSKNRRSSTRRSNNTSGFFNENTDIIDNDDPLWFDRTIVRPSTSLILTRRASSILNSDSTVNTSQISGEWFNNLTQSDSSKLMEKAIRKNIKKSLENEQNNSHNEDLNPESESDPEFRKKRSKFKLNKKNQNKTDNSNVFLKALEKTIDSSTTNLTNVQMLTENESESTNDDSKTVKKLRPNIFKSKKRLKDKSKNFDDVFNSDSVLEKSDTIKKSVRSPIKKKNNDNQNSLTQKIINNSSKNVVNDNSTDYVDKTTFELQKKILHSEAISKKTNLVEESSQQISDNVDVRSTSDDITNKSNSVTENLRKKQTSVFAQEHKNRTNQNLFDAILQEKSNPDYSNTTNLFESQSSRNKKLHNILEIPLLQKSKEINDSANDTQAETSSSSSKNSPKNSPKKKYRLLKKKKVPSENIFDEVFQIENLMYKDTSKTDNVLRIETKSLKKKSSKIHSSSRSSLKSIQKSMKNQTVNVSSINEPFTHEQTGTDSKQVISENESSSLPKYIRRTKSQVFTKVISDNIEEDDNEISDVLYSSRSKSSEESNGEKLTNDSQKNNLSSNEMNLALSNDIHKPKSNVFMLPRVSLQRLSKEATSHSVLHKKNKNQSNQTIEESRKSRDEMVTKKTTELKENSHLSNAATSKRNENGTSVNSSNKNIFETQDNGDKDRSISTRKSLSTEDDVGEDLLRTPNPAQSTLNPSGKPVARITQFSFRNSDIDETTSSSAQSAQNVENALKENRRNETVRAKASTILDKTNNISLDPGHESDHEHFRNLSSNRKELSFSNNRSTNFEKISKNSTISESTWSEVKKKIDLIKEASLARLKREKENERKLEKEKMRIDAKVKRSMALKKVEQKKKQMKPIDKAFYVNGKLYKPPKLPRPKNWVSDRLYKHLWKCMESKFGPRTRVKSEKFITKLSNISSLIIKRKKYENYVENLDNLIVVMAKLNIIKTRYDFYRFCSDFMPYNFRIKVVPMQLPGNKRNIPYDPKLLNEPILEENSNSHND